MPNPLSHLRTLAAYQAERPDLFRSIEALRWFVRQHRAELLAAGALASWGKSLLVDPEKADQVVLKVATRRVSEAA